MTGKEVFLSYSREDRLRAQRVVRALERHGWSVWWDQTDIPPGSSYRHGIDEAMRAAKAMVVLWSVRSILADWVKDEADYGRKRGILVPALLDDVEIPLGFRQLQHARLCDWRGDESDSELSKLLVGVTRLVPPPKGKPRVREPQISTKGSRSPEAEGDRDPYLLNRPLNLGFDGPFAQGFPDGWFNGFGYVARVSVAYRVRMVARPEANGACVLLERSGSHEYEFGALMQRCAASRLAGRTVRFEGELRSESVGRWAGLWLRADGDEQGDLHFDNMHRRPVRGTTSWKKYSIDAQLPEGTRWLNYGVVLDGDGKVWVDNCELLVWDEAGEWTKW